ncbi:MAG: hypothetical protein MRQ07_03025 [Candidatus Midichloria sp.]|nr:hypothetical protein [Candidatus Midichloria sp.]
MMAGAPGIGLGLDELTGGLFGRGIRGAVYVKYSSAGSYQANFNSSAVNGRTVLFYMTMLGLGIVILVFI